MRAAVSQSERRTRVAVLEAHDWTAWSEGHARGELAGQLGPYGAEQLSRQDFALSWSDAAHHLPWRVPPVVRPLRKLATVRPELTGARDVLASTRVIAKAELTLAMFEDQGMAAAFARVRGAPPFARRPLVLVACWLAETVRGMDERELEAHRGALVGADRVCCFSRNQLEVFERDLGVDAERLRFVPFGVDDDFYAPREQAEEAYVLAVGRDRSRDHRSLMEAVRGTDIRVRLVSPQPELSALAPANVEVLEAVDHRTYRELLARAAVVAVPTTAPRYPSGQTVLLEAMAMGKAVVSTDSSAMRDYVQHGVTGMLTPVGDRGALRETLAALLGDRSRRVDIGGAAHASVRQSFNHRTMWRAIAGVLGELAPPAP